MTHTPFFILRTLAALVMCAYFAACTSAEVRQRSGSAVRGLNISTVAVAPGASLHPDDVAFLRENRVEDTLTAAIRARLSETGKLQPNGATLAVNISSVRVRSTAAAVMLGIMAGPDHMDANVAVIDKGQTLTTFTAEGDRTSGAFQGPGSLTRVERLSEELAMAIVGEL